MTDLAILDDTGDNIVLFKPYIPYGVESSVCETLRTRWIGQGPKVEVFEARWAYRFGNGTHGAVAVGSGTDALHLAYILAGIGPGDEVIVPVFTCTATSIPLLYLGAVPIFADIDPDTMNIDPNSVRHLITPRTKAIVVVHYGGFPCDMTRLTAIAKTFGIPIIEDAAHAPGAIYGGKPVGSLSPYTIFSLQAIKHITTGDGGMLMLSDPAQIEKAKRIRWFGIDRKGKQQGIWANDVTEVGYKYQMTDIAASMGIAALGVFDNTLINRRILLQHYYERLFNVGGITLVGGFEESKRFWIDTPMEMHAAWLCTIRALHRKDLQEKLREHHIEAAQVHFRNDMYSIFKHLPKQDLPHMDNTEDDYLVLPLYPQLSIEAVDRICDVIKDGW